MSNFTSRARCVPLPYLSSATRGVNQELNFNKKLSNQNFTVVSTLLQERKSIADQTYSPPYKTKCQSPSQVSQTESGMFYELSNKRRMECERYQDCSWFQQDSMKEGFNHKLSLAEAVEPVIDTNELDLAMQFANAHTIPWGDEYLEVFDDDILLENKNGEKTKNILNPSNGNYSYANCKTAEDSAYDTCNINYSLRKTDSFDSMKNISLTNPAEIIPISYKERLNNTNYGLKLLNDIKSEVKEELEPYSPESNMYPMDSDDSDLNIGREETIEEEKSNEDPAEINKKQKIDANNKATDFTLNTEVKLSTSTAEEPDNDSNLTRCKPLGTLRENCNHDSLLVKTECSSGSGQVPDEKLDLHLDLAKVNFEPSISVNTPDLDFMDLVEYINEEMHPVHENSSALIHSQNGNVQLNASSNPVPCPSKKSGGTKDIQPITPKHTSLLKGQKLNLPNITSDNSTIGQKDTFEEDFCDTNISIAERIKTSAKRRTPRKYNIRDIDISEDDEACQSNEIEDEDDDDDDDYDYDCKESTTKRRCISLRNRSKSNASESSSSSKKEKDDHSHIIGYRERRDKNNEASRRSRQNRKDRERHMFKTLEEEEKRNVKLKAEAEVLEKQVTSLRQLLLQVVLRKGGAT